MYHCQFKMSSGLSTGTRLVSTSRIIKIEIEIRTFNGLKNGIEDIAEFVNIRYKSVVLKTNASAAKTIIITGSNTADIVISLELPILPKVLPASNPDNAIKNFPRARR